MAISRRRFVGLSLASATGMLGGGYWFDGIPKAIGRQRFTSTLKIPPLVEGRGDVDGRRFDLLIKAGKTEFFDDVSTPTIGVNGTYLGPTLKCRTGDRIAIDVSNELDMNTTLHWHGLHVPAKADGGPHQVVAPGDTWSPSFALKQKAATFWYHSHLMGQTGRQVNQGLAGLILVQDDEVDALGLPVDYGVDDVPVVVQDRRFDRDGSFAYTGSMHDVMMGFRGDTILVNGTVDPHFVVRRERTRLRLLNGSNARIYNFGFNDGRDFLQIASDGSLLERAVRRKRLRLSPGERAEVLVDMVANSRVVLMSYPDISRAGGMMGGMNNGATFPVLELRADRLEASNKRIPDRLVEVPNWHRSKASQTRQFDLNMPMMGGMMGMGMMGGGRSGRDMHDFMGINGKSMSMYRVDERVPLGAIEIWSIRNDTPMSHPFHIHDIQFRVLARNGQRPAAYEDGLKDTVLVDPGETVEVITQFADYADPDRPYMYHCHILEHEDAGMMGQFVVEA